MANNHPRSFFENLVLEVFGEWLSRVTPGAVALALFAHEPILRAYSQFKDSQILFAVSLLTTAWLVGVFIDVCGFVPFAFILMRFKERLKPIHDFAMPDRPPIQDKKEDERQFISYTKYSSERIMLRCIAFTFVISAIMPPSLFTELLNWNRCHSIVFALIAAIGWAWSLKFEDRYQKMKAARDKASES